MQPHQQRVVDAQLPKDEQARLRRQFDIMIQYEGVLQEREQARLRRQFDIMIQYEGVLQERIDHFPN